MSGNLTGSRLIISTFGESHGPALGVVMDGFPAGVPIDLELLRSFLNKRRPGQSDVTTSRNEEDQYEILSGVFEGYSLGSPIAVIVRNKDAKSEDYKEIKNNSRVGHADDLWTGKYGRRDHRGGGRSSGRETVSRVIAGAFSKMLINHLYKDLEVISFTRQIGHLEIGKSEMDEVLNSKDLSKKIEANSTRCPVDRVNKAMSELLVAAKSEGKSYGGIAEVVIKNAPANLGQPVFRKLKADLGAGILSVGATIGIEFGAGFDSAKAEGTEFHSSSENPVYGGIRGGISTGEDLNFRVAFKPTSSVTDVAKKGRHDPCIVPRAVAVLEAMTYIVLADHILCRTTDIVENIHVDR